jgi:hypothetical protein
LDLLPVPRVRTVADWRHGGLCGCKVWLAVMVGESDV